MVNIEAKLVLRNEEDDKFIIIRNEKNMYIAIDNEDDRCIFNLSLQQAIQVRETLNEFINEETGS